MSHHFNFTLGVHGSAGAMQGLGQHGHGNRHGPAASSDGPQSGRFSAFLQAHQSPAAADGGHDHPSGAENTPAAQARTASEDPEFQGRPFGHAVRSFAPGHFMHMMHAMMHYMEDHMAAHQSETTPITGEDPDMTETPDVTETPETPETPESPDIADNPDIPETPETPESPEPPAVTQTPPDAENLTTADLPDGNDMPVALSQPNAEPVPDTQTVTDAPAEIAAETALNKAAVVAVNADLTETLMEQLDREDDDNA